jgi:hypothetical protein
MNLLDVKKSGNSEYEIPCIYGIYVNGELVYIGKANSAIDRWIVHKHHIIKPYEKCRKYYNDFTKLYVQLREDYFSNECIEFRIIEKVPKEKLSEVERKYLRQNKPKLNTKNY